MFRNYLTIALRTIQRSASYTMINVSGLALGTTCALLIFLLVSYHLDFDNFHPDGDRVYRFVTEQRRDLTSYSPAVPPSFGKAFNEDYTYGEVIARICREGGVVSFDHNGTTQKFNEDFSFADPTYFDIFSFPLLQGVNQLGEPGTAIVTERIAKKYFGDESPVGKVLRIESTMEFRITALMKDLPANTDMRSEIFLSYQNIGQWSEWYASDDAWGGITSSILTFVRLQPGVDPAVVEASIQEYPKKFRPNAKNLHVYHLQPLSDIHFNQTYDGRISKTVLLVLSVIGFFLVFTACLNFINLATAQAVGRAREVGVRKVLGSMRSQLFWQFTLETFVIVIFSFIISFCLCYALVPLMNELLDARIIMTFNSIIFWLFSAGLIVLLTLLSGAYPGLVLSGFRPVQALKGKMAAINSGNLSLRRVLITAQFTISQVLLIGLFVVVWQMEYFSNADLGFDKEAIVMIPVGSHDARTKTVKEQIRQLPDVASVSLCFTAPASDQSWGTSIQFDNRDENEEFNTQFKGGDEDYVGTFGLDLIAGRNLLPSDSVRECLVNETLVAKLGETPESILGKKLVYNDEFHPIIVGVVNDFHDRSLHNEISPVFIAPQLDNLHSYAIKINMNNMRETIAAIEKVWSAAYPEKVFDTSFVDDQTAEFYEAEAMILRVVEIFAVIALFIGCMGLYGLVSFMSVQKTKEIGIRKVLGGSIQHILWIFGREFTTLIGLAFVIASPIAWILMTRWLENFTYKIDLTAWIFLANLGVIAAVALFTVGFRSARAATMNPVNALRAE